MFCAQPVDRPEPQQGQLQRVEVGAVVLRGAEDLLDDPPGLGIAPLRRQAAVLRGQVVEVDPVELVEPAPASAARVLGGPGRWGVGLSHDDSLLVPG